MTATLSAAATVAAYQSGTPAGPYAVSDTGADVLANLAGLQSVAAAFELSSVSVSDSSSPLSVSEATYNADRRFFNVSGNYKVALTGVAAADSFSLYGGKVTSESIVDSAANVIANLGNLDTLQIFSGLTSITLTDPGTPVLVLSASNWTQHHAVIAKIQGNFSATVTGIDANSASQMTSLSYISGVSVSDTVNGVRNALASLETLATQSKLTSIAMTDGATNALSLSAAQFASDADALAKMTGSYSLAVTGVTAANAASLVGQAHVATVAISDSSANLNAALDGLETLATAGQIASITPTDYNLLQVSQAQMINDASVLAKFSFYGLDVLGVGVAAASTLISQSHVYRLEIADSAANISANLATIQSEAQQGKIGSIGVTDGGTINATYNQFNSSNNWRYELTGTYGLSVSGVDYHSNATSVLSQSHVVSVAVTDSASDLPYSLDGMQVLVNAGKLTGISLTDSGTPLITLSATQFSADSGALALMTGSYGIAVTGLTVASAIADAALSHVTSVAIADTAGNINGSLDALEALAASGEIASLQVTDGGTITATAAQSNADTALFAKLSGPHHLVLQGVSASGALADAWDFQAQIGVSDSAANIVANLDALLGVAEWGQLTGITLTDVGIPTLSLTGEQVSNDVQVLSAISGAYQITATGITAAQFATLVATGHLASASVADAAASLSSDLDALQAGVAAGQLTSITLTDPGTPVIALTTAQLASDGGVLALISSPYSITVTGVSAADAGAVATLSHVITVVVSDSAAAIAGNADALQALLSAGTLASTVVSDGGTLTVSGVQAVADSQLLGSLQGSYSLSVQGIDAADAAGAGALSHVQSITVSDSAAHVVANLDALQGLGALLTGISLTDSGTPLLSLSAAQVSNDAQVLAEISTPYQVAAAGITVTEFSALASQGHLASASISDSGWTVVGSLDAMQAGVASGQITGITLTDSSTVWMDITYDTLLADAQALQAISGPHDVFIMGVSAANTATTAASSVVNYLAVFDSMANIEANLDMLQSVIGSGKIDYISPTDSSTQTLTVTPGQLVADQAAINLVFGNGVVNVTLDAPNVTVTNALSFQGTVAVFSGSSDLYSVTASPTSDSVTVTDIGTGRTSTDTLTGFEAIKFSDLTEIVARTPGDGTTTVTTGNTAALYAAVLGREPDAAGLNNFEHSAEAPPYSSLASAAQSIMEWSEYANNPAHSYAETAAGETQFVTDLFSNLLDRAPNANELSTYLTLIGQFTQGVTPGTAGYAAADLEAHAAVLANFSTLPEFLASITITAQTPASAQHWLFLTN